MTLYICGLARSDIDDLIGRLNKIENNNKMKDVLSEAASLSDNSVDLILKAIDDMQSKINNEVDDKLQNYVTLPKLDDLEQEVKSIGRRVGHNEGQLKNTITDTEKNAEMIDNNRKKIGRLQTEID